MKYILACIIIFLKAHNNAIHNIHNWIADARVMLLIAIEIKLKYPICPCWFALLLITVISQFDYSYTLLRIS